MKEYAVHNDNEFLNKRRYKEGKINSRYIRDEFQRDRDRILHSRSFRRMMHKTQIFNSNKGDHYRNRLTHTLEVTQIARSIGKFLDLNDELIEAIALGHDLGHTPFGHIGERTLHNIIANGAISEISPIGEGFKHNLQSLRVVDELESRCNDYPGLNLTLAVREGIIKHTKRTINDKIVKYRADYTDMNLNSPSYSLEGQVVEVADEIAQYTHDLEDGVRSNIIELNSVLKNDLIRKVIADYKISVNENTKTPTYDMRNLIISNLVGYLIEDVCKTSILEIESYINKYNPDLLSIDNCFQKRCIQLSGEIGKLSKELYNMVNEKVICSEQISIEDAKAEYIIKQIFKAYYKHPKQLPDYVLQKYYKRIGTKFVRVKMDDNILQKDTEFIRTICDHIAGMTDQFAAREHNRLYVPNYI